MMRFATLVPACHIGLALPAAAQDPVTLTFADTPPPSIAWAGGRQFGTTIPMFAAFDLNGDGVDEAFVRSVEMTSCRGNRVRCMTQVWSIDANGTYSGHGAPYADTFIVLPTVTHGWRDLEVDGTLHTISSDGGAYGARN